MDNPVKWDLQLWIDHRNKEHNGTVGIPCDDCAEANAVLFPGTPLTWYLVAKRPRRPDLPRWE